MDYFCRGQCSENASRCSSLLAHHLAAAMHPDAPCLTITLPQAKAAGFASLLQHGILFAVDGPVAIRPFLLSLPGFSADYIEGAVQTIFINGVAADSLDKPLAAGSTLALSAAMPGLAGAIFRKQGAHGSLRSRQVGDAAPAGAEAGFLTLKLFNSIAADRVLDLTSRGVLLQGKAVREFAARRPDLFQPPADLSLDSRAMEYAELMTAIEVLPMVAIRLHCQDETAS